MANAKKDDNGSQFFFTLGTCPELQSKNTIFGKASFWLLFDSLTAACQLRPIRLTFFQVTGDTLYNMLKLDDVMVDRDDRPLYPPTIISTQVLANPFSDIVPRSLAPNKKEDKLDEPSKQVKSKGTK